MDSPIEDAIAEAKDQASRLPVIINPRKLTMSDLESSSLDVESWLQVDKYGLHLDKSQEALEALLVEIDLNKIVPVYMVRFGKNPPNYCRSLRRRDDLQLSKAMGAHGARRATSGCRLPRAVLGGRNPDDPHRDGRTQA